MVWVRSEYAGELAVLSAWLSALAPWSLTYFTGAPLGSTVVFLRFGLFELQLRWAATITGPDGQQVGTAAEPLAVTYHGTRLFGDLFVSTPVGAVGFYDGTMGTASLAWLVGAVVLVVALVLSFAMYRDESGVEAAAPVDPVRLMGGLLGGAALALTAATALLYLARDAAGVPIPLGLVFVYLLSGILLTVDRT